LLSEAKRKADYMLGYTKSFDHQLDAVPTVDFGLTKESYKEGKRHDELFLSFNALKIKLAAEILTPNHLEA
jgi:hypothetical protein